MNYSLLHDLLRLVEEFEKSHRGQPATVDSFRQWLAGPANEPEPEWEGKLQGRSADSVINTLIVHMGRYARTYSRSAISGSEFGSQEEFIYMINLRAFGKMGKMELIKRNVHDKPTGMQIINRLIDRGWVNQEDSTTDRRSKIVGLTPAGEEALTAQMSRIRQASAIVSANLSYPEKMQLIRLLTKLECFHQDIYQRQIDTESLIDTATEILNSSRSDA